MNLRKDRDSGSKNREFQFAIESIINNKEALIVGERCTCKYILCVV